MLPSSVPSSKGKPRSAVEAIRLIRDKVSLLLDLTFYLLQFPDPELKESLEVLSQDIRMCTDWLVLHVVSAISPIGDNRLILPFVELVHQVRRVVDSIYDFIKFISFRNTPPLLLLALEESEEQVGVLEVSKSTTIRDLISSLDIAIDIIAVKHKGSWTLDPDERQKLEPGDLIVYRTNRDAVQLLERSPLVKLRRLRVPEIKNTERARIGELVRDLAHIKNISEVVFDIACLVILTQDKDAISELQEIEQYFDIKHIDIQKRTIETLGSLTDTLVIVRFSSCLEEIVDAALAIAGLVYRYPDAIPVLQKGVIQGEEVLLRFRVTVDNVKLSELNLDNLGLTVIAVKRSSDYIILPPPSTQLRKGDILIIRGYKDSLKEVKNELIRLLEPL